MQKYNINNMKKIALTLFATAPMILFAQAPAPATGEIGSVLIVLLICVIIFIICRELLCWYYKINKMVSNQEEIIRLLKKIADKGEGDISSKNKETIIDQFNKK